MFKSSFDHNLDHNNPIRVPLMKLQMPRLKTSIHKRKDWLEPATFEKKKFCFPVKKVPEPSLFSSQSILKRPLQISIPDDSEVKVFTPGSRVKSVSNFADTNEGGSFYGVTLKKGSFRRTNEDRVFFLRV